MLKKHFGSSEFYIEETLGKVSTANDGEKPVNIKKGKSYPTPLKIVTGSDSVVQLFGGNAARLRICPETEINFEKAMGPHDIVVRLTRGRVICEYVESPAEPMKFQIIIPSAKVFISDSQTPQPHSLNAGYFWVSATGLIDLKAGNLTVIADNHPTVSLESRTVFSCDTWIRNSDKLGFGEANPVCEVHRIPLSFRKLPLAGARLDHFADVKQSLKLEATYPYRHVFIGGCIVQPSFFYLICSECLAYRNEASPPYYWQFPPKEMPFRRKF